MLRAGEKVTEGEFSEAAGTVFNSVQEDLLGKTMVGLFGPEGVGGTLIGALPEQVRQPAGQVIDPVFGAMNWGIQELVDRPLGTAFTVLNSGIANGPQSLMDLDMYARAWKINDERSFGQSFAASLYMIDPFDEDEYNSIEDNPIFDMISGTADFMQEFIDPTVIVGGGLLKFGRGSLVTSKYGRRLTKTPATRVIGRGVGVRPASIASRNIDTLGKPMRFAGVQLKQNPLARLVKNEGQMANVRARLTTVAGERGKAFSESAQFVNLNAAVQLVDPKDRFGALRNGFGRAGRHVRPEVIELISSGPTEAARAMTMRLVAGDIGALKEINETAIKLQGLHRRLDDVEQHQRVSIEFGGADRGLFDEVGELRAQIDELEGLVDWGAADMLQDAYVNSQQKFMTQGPNGLLTEAESFSDSVWRMNPETKHAAFDAMIGDDINAVASQFAGWGSLDELPMRGRASGLFQRHLDQLQKTGDNLAVTEFHSPYSLRGRLGKKTFVFTEKVSQTIADFSDASSVVQFERMLRDANRVVFTDEATGVATRLIDEQAINQKLSEYARLNLGENATGGRAGLFNSTVEELNLKAGKAMKEHPRYKDVEMDARSLHDAWIKGNTDLQTSVQRQQAIGITDGIGGEGTKLTIPGVGDGADFVVFFRNSPSQLQNSSIVPRFDIVGKQVEIADKAAGINGASGKAQAFFGSGVRAASRRAGRHVEAPQQFWRSAVLLTPKWPMRVGIDEQLRIGSVLGGMTMISGLVSGYGDLRRALAVRNLKAGRGGFDDTAAIEAKMAEMAKAAGKKFDEEPAFWDLHKEVGPEGYRQAIRDVTRESLKANKERKLLARNAGLRGIAVAALINPVTGLAFGMGSLVSRRLRINKAAVRHTALNHASELRQQGRALLRDSAGSPEQLAVARQTMSDAAYMEKLVKEHADEIGEARNLFDVADELMLEAGAPSLMIGNMAFRNAFGDDPAFHEMWTRQVSMNRAQGQVMRGAVRESERQLERFGSTDWKAWDVLDGGVDSAGFADKWHRMMNLYTSTDVSNSFYDIVWSAGSAEERVASLTKLLTDDKVVFNQIVDQGFDFIDDASRSQIAESIVREFDNVLPPEFADLRSQLRDGKTVEWDAVKDELGENPVERIEEIRAGEYADFGKSIGPDPASIKGPSRSGASAKMEEFTAGLFEMFGQLPSDNLARSPLFKAKYDIEMRRRIEPLLDADGNARISQVAIDRFEREAREAAITEVRSVLYDLAEESRFGEVIGNAMPFFNAWQEVISRWGGQLTYNNPMYTAEMFRLYKKEWEAEALGISEVTVNEGEENESTYLMFRPFGSAYDENGDATTIFEAMSPAVRNLLIPKAVQDRKSEIRFSKDGLNTMLQASMPGVGPVITIPVRELVLDNPEMESTFQFMFPFGHPEGGFFDRAIKGNAPTWAKSAIDLVSNSHTNERVVQRMFLDLVVQHETAGMPVDWGDEEEINELISEANDRAQDFHMFRISAGLFSPSSTTLSSPYAPLEEIVRDLTEKHGFRKGHEMFLSEYGEEFFALTARMTKLNNGVAASVESAELAEQHQGLVQAFPEVGSWLTLSNMGAADEQYMFSQAVYRTQQQTPMAPGSDVMMRERKTPRETVADTEAELGWIKYSVFMDFQRSKQDEAEAAGLSTSLNSKHLLPLRTMKQDFVAQLALEHPDWHRQHQNFGASDERTRAVMDGFMAGLRDPAIAQRPSSVHVAEYMRLRMYVQTQLESRKAVGGSANIEHDDNEDLWSMWETEKEALSMRTEFSAIYDRYFERDSLRVTTFMSNITVDDFGYLEAVAGL